LKVYVGRILRVESCSAIIKLIPEYLSVSTEVYVPPRDEGGSYDLLSIRREDVWGSRGIAPRILNLGTR